MLFKILRKYWHFLFKLLLVFEKKLIITLVFEKNGNFFCRKLANIAENNDHNIYPRSGKKITYLIYIIFYTYFSLLFMFLFTY
jgi:hypothetical protein